MVTTDVFVFTNAFFMFYLNVVCFPHLCLIYDFCVFFVYLFTTFLMSNIFLTFCRFSRTFFFTRIQIFFCVYDKMHAGWNEMLGGGGGGS